MIELRMFCYNLSYTIMSDIYCIKRIKIKFLFNEKFTNYHYQRETLKAFRFLFKMPGATYLACSHVG